MQTIKDLQQELEKLNSTIERLLEQSRYTMYDDLSGLEYNAAEPEEQLLKEELGSILYRLEEVSSTIAYLSRPIKSIGKLHKGSNGRYSFNDIELSSGYGIEALVPTEVCINGEWQEGYKWLASRIEHNGEDYYIVGYSGALEGLTVRVRERR